MNYNFQKVMKLHWQYRLKDGLSQSEALSKAWEQVNKYKKENDKINHPTHYNIDGRKECISEMIDIYGVDNVITFCVINAYKYKYRAGYKQNNSKLDDLLKAKWYLEKAEELNKKVGDNNEK